MRCSGLKPSGLFSSASVLPWFAITNTMASIVTSYVSGATILVLPMTDGTRYDNNEASYKLWRILTFKFTLDEAAYKATLLFFVPHLLRCCSKDLGVLEIRNKNTYQIIKPQLFLAGSEHSAHKLGLKEYSSQSPLGS